MDRKQVCQEGLEILIQLFRGDIVFFREYRCNLMYGASPVNAVPQRCAGFVQYVNAVGLSEGPADGDEDAFSCHIPLNEIWLFQVDGVVVHRGGSIANPLNPFQK